MDMEIEGGGMSAGNKSKHPGRAGKWKKKRGADVKLYGGADAAKLINKSVDDTDQLYTYNVTNFKVSELIAEATFSAPQRAAIKQSFEELKKVILNTDAVPADELKVKVPAPDCLRTTKLQEECTFETAVSVELCGSFPIGQALSSTTTVDVRVVIPKTCFKSKDFLNQRWLVRKAYYAAVLAHSLLDHDSTMYDMEYTCPQDNPLDVCLLVNVKDSVTFRILLNAEEGLFLNKRLTPLVNNVRPTHVGLPAVDDDVDLSYTPLYNNTLAMNQNYAEAEEMLQYWSQKSDVINHCMILTKIWLRQRSLDQGFQSINSFILRSVMVDLLIKKKLAFHTTAYQMFTAFLQKIVAFDWLAPISLKRKTTPEEMALLKQACSYIFLDPTGRVNYFEGLCHNRLQQLVQHAKETVAIILKDAEGSFEDVFIKKLPPHRYYDQAICVRGLSSLRCWLSDESDSQDEDMCIDEDRYVDGCGDEVYGALSNFLDMLKQALGDRVTTIAAAPTRRGKINASGDVEFSSKSKDDQVIIYFHINPDRAYDNLERGPAADDPKAELFRNFWGERSNLRRFMDGAICEAVVWPGESAAERRMITSHISAYVLEKFCKVKSGSVTSAVNQLDDFLMYDNFELQRYTNTGEEDSIQYQTEFHIVSKAIRAVKSLPLSITNIHGLDSLSRNTKVFITTPTPSRQKRQNIEANRVMVVVEGSKWPGGNDKERDHAVSTLKLLMLLKLKETLSKLEGWKCFIRDEGLTVFKAGFQYDIVLMNEVELVGLRNDHNTGRGDSHKFMEYIALPQISNTLAGLQTQHTCFAATARLFKRWAGVHMLSSFIPEPVTDLIAASLFIHPAPFQVPRSPMVALYRCLGLLAHHDWSNDPLVINFNEELSDDVISELKADFRNRRIQFPCATLITPIDKASHISRRVMPFMWKLVCDTASRCLLTSDDHLAAGEWGEDLLKAATFSPDYSTLDVLIELKSDKFRRRVLTIKQDGVEMDLFCDPAVDYVKHIQESYADKMIVMYDSNSIKHIGLVWKPGCFNPTPAEMVCAEELLAARSLEQIDDDVCVKLDIDALLQDLNLCGQDIVENITVQSLPEF